MTKSELDLLLGLLKEVREDQKQHGKELSKQSVYLETMDADVKELKNTVGRNTEDIAEHIRRTDLLEKLHRDNQFKIESSEKRLDKLEEPKKAMAWVKAHLISLLAILASIATIVANILKSL